MSFSEKAWEEGEKLYHKAEQEIKAKKKCSLAKADRTDYEELRGAFLPGRTLASVSKPCNRISKLAETIFANNDLLKNESEPSCRDVGLDEKAKGDDIIFNRCSIEEKHMSCDCPDGQAEYDPKAYAKENVTKCLNGEGAEMYYTDYPESLEKAHVQYRAAKEKKDVSEMVLGCDAMVNAIHRSGPMAKFFVKGGLETLEKLKKD